MRIPPLVFVGIVVLLAAGAAFYFLRPAAGAYGPHFALCPGPDQYGYTCESAATYAYVAGEVDTGLHLDDGTVTVPLPFPFRFYGRVYEQVTISSNGNLQFSTANSTFLNECLEGGAASGMGELVAAYWDDLDLTFTGVVATAVAGEAPQRRFIVEWQDVPRYAGDLDDTVTFAVQLHEATGDIVVLYQDVTTDRGANGRLAVVGLQSESAAITLSFSCRQAVIADPGGLRFAYPAVPNEAAVPESAARTARTAAAVAAKGDVAALLARLPWQGRAALPALNQQWRSSSERPRSATWQWLGEAGAERLVVLWRGPGDAPRAARLAVVDAPLGDSPGALLDVALADRTTVAIDPVILAVADYTGDGADDIVVHDRVDGRHWLAGAAADGTWRLARLPDQCRRADILGAPASIPAAAGCDLAAVLATFEGASSTE